MTMRYTRWTPFDQVPATVEHVRAHLSAVASPDDNPDTHADDVHIDMRDHDGGVLVFGELDADPVADYLRDGFDPDGEAGANPLSVPPIEDRP